MGYNAKAKYLGERNFQKLTRITYLRKSGTRDLPSPSAENFHDNGYRN